MKMKRKPVIAITIGDAAGIGPEVVVKALLDETIHQICCPIVIGDYSVVRGALESVHGEAELHSIEDIEKAATRSGQINLIDLANLSSQVYIPGKVSPVCGAAAAEYIYKAADLALNKQVDAIVTAPINKEATRQAGYGELGHLEMLALYTNTKEYATILVSGPLRVVHLTTHYALKEALEHVNEKLISRRLALIDRTWQAWGLASPRIGVAALNPHGGEGGILGREEIEQILPAITRAGAAGIQANGPYPADSIFNRAIHGEFDVVLAMYHDQGHIAIKVYGFEKSYSVALGLPFIRTSVDHGTAFDIAGKGIANAESMKEAIKAAVSLVNGNPAFR
jgi:4-phospho-D-threonate 3-dehydrogenase / 4-phospho-D-erythronate 3-dehydrogenase